MCREKFKKIIIMPLFSVLSFFCVSILSAVIYMNYSLPSDFKVLEGKTLTFESNIPISAVFEGYTASDVNLKGSTEKDYNVELKALGIFPIKNASVSVIDEADVLVMGNPFGVKIYTDGVMVVGIDSVDTEAGNKTPGTDAGLKLGDLIISINGQKVYSNEDVAAIIESCGGSVLKFKICRENKNLALNIKPELSYSSGKFKTGIWVRDSSAGIGTLTFYSPAAGIICGLGHGVCDIDTGEILTINSGELVEAEVICVKKGSSGNPGEIKGRFVDNSIGELLVNCETGVFASCNMEYNADNLIEIALKQEVKKGAAKILTTIDGENEPKLYDCIIEEVTYNNSITKNMVVKITDKELIEKTGGIVQGMSGSPIIQNGKLIGAITHVFIDDSTGGYAIFAENMLETAESVANEKLKKVS